MNYQEVGSYFLVGLNIGYDHVALLPLPAPEIDQAWIFLIEWIRLSDCFYTNDVGVWLSCYIAPASSIWCETLCRYGCEIVNTFAKGRHSAFIAHELSIYKLCIYLVDSKVWGQGRFLSRVYLQAQQSRHVGGCCPWLSLMPYEISDNR